MAPLLDLFAVFASLFETKLLDFQAFEYLLSFVLISYGINHQIICIKNNYQKTYYFMMQNILKDHRVQYRLYVYRQYGYRDRVFKEII